MITHWSILLAISGGLLLMFNPVALARPEPYLAKDEIPGEEMLGEMIEDADRLHNQEINYLHYLGSVAAQQQLEQALLQHQLRKQQQHELKQQQQQQLGEENSALDDETAAAAAENPIKSLNRLARLQDVPKPVALAYQKPKEEKKSNHYMSLCHFKLCNMGRKRNTRYLSFWN